MTPIRPAGLPLGKLPFTPAIQANGFLFISGQASTDPAGNIVPDTFEGEMRRTIENLRAILTAAGLTFADVVQVRSYVAKQEQLTEYNRIYRDYFSEPFPARTTLVNCLGTVIQFELDAVAVAKPS
jgi:2-iminobutanoate/2-iminopropanoate deaminase